jgi:lysophospholipase L1-like esterase
VVNEGIGGNRVLSDGMGIKALARFDRDVLSQPSVSHVVVMEGINDIGWPGTFLTPPEEPVTVVRALYSLFRNFRESTCCDVLLSQPV